VPDRDPRIGARAYLFPPRGSVLAAVGERPGSSVREIAERLGLPQRRVRHHLEALLADGLIEVDAGASGARRYSGGVTVFEDTDLLDPTVRAAIVRDTFRLLLRDIATSRAAGVYGTRLDDHSIRIYGEVDAEGLAELGEMHHRVYRRISAAMESGRRRVRAGGEEGTEIVSAIFFFEAPIWGEVAPTTPPVRRGAPVDPAALLEAQSNPVRSRVLSALAERPGVSIRELALRVEETPRRVRHHVEALAAAGLARVTGEALRAGVVERRHGAGSLLVVDVGPFDLAARRAMAESVVQLLIPDIATAEAAGTFGRHDEEVEARFYGVVDERCLAELAEICRRAYPEFQGVVDEATRRVCARGGRGVEVVSALFLFEAPVWAGIG
jgi:DNA-binding transcriptional ArsR family regulator